MRAWSRTDRLRVLCLALALSVLAAPVHAAGFFVHSATTHLVDRVFRLDAEIDYRFSEETLEALHNGVPLILNLDIQVVRQRTYLWNETIANLDQRYRLGYHALADQYLVTNLNSGARYNYSTLNAAIAALGHLTDLPLLDEDLINPAETYTGKLRARLDVERLPTPLRLLAYFSSAWSLSSSWYTWPIQH